MKLVYDLGTNLVLHYAVKKNHANFYHPGCEKPNAQNATDPGVV
jgi:hypothetical protein